MEMKWEFTSWGESVLLIYFLRGQVQHHSCWTVPPAAAVAQQSLKHVCWSRLMPKCNTLQILQYLECISEDYLLSSVVSCV